jgi:hypothetical protein
VGVATGVAVGVGVGVAVVPPLAEPVGLEGVAVFMPSPHAERAIVRGRARLKRLRRKDLVIEGIPRVSGDGLGKSVLYRAAAALAKPYPA